jgi:Holliday junction resolvasome RuvABC DNA-binding subunit
MNTSFHEALVKALKKLGWEDSKIDDYIKNLTRSVDSK